MGLWYNEPRNHSDLWFLMFTILIRMAQTWRLHLTALSSSPFPFSVRQTQDLSHFFCSWFLLWNDLQFKKNCHYYYYWYVCVFVCMYMQEHIPWHACGEQEDNFPKFSCSAVGSGDEFRLSGSHSRCFPWLWATLEALLSNNFHGIYRAQKDPKSIVL